MSRNKVLLVDDEPQLLSTISEYLRLQKYEVATASTCEAAERTFRTFKPDAAVVDHHLPDGDATALVPTLKQIDASVPIIVVTGHGTIDMAVQAIKQGAEQFLTKPVELSALLTVISRAIENQRRRDTESASRVRDERGRVDPFLGTSTAIRELFKLASKVAMSDRPVLIQGETGAGKGVLARWIHDHSPRADEAFVDLNCAGFTREFLETELFGYEKGAYTGAAAAKPGLLEVAHRGTVFLDEIGDMDSQIQPRLLKVLEDRTLRRLGDIRDRKVDIRLIAATHQDLATLVRDGRFRSDLYFRISSLPLRVPSLLERREDIEPLANEFVKRYAAETGRNAILTTGALDALRSYSWPGNIRELKNVIERAMLLSDSAQLTAAEIQFDLNPASAPRSEESKKLSDVERAHIQTVLAECDGNVNRAAAILGVPRSTLYKKIKELQLESKF